MLETPKILVVCGQNKRRSRTAEQIFKNDKRFQIRSVGLSSASDRKIRDTDVDWSDFIMVMEDNQGDRINKTYKHLDLPFVEVLHIPDEYAYLDKDLMGLLTDRINSILDIEFDI